MPKAPVPLPTGRVTFAFTDVVGSTRAFLEHGEAYAEALRALHKVIERHAGTGNGVVVETEGDGAFLAFPDAASAVATLVALQSEVEATRPGSGPKLRIRIGAHTGEAVPVGGRYLALAVYVAARVGSVAGAGQVMVTDAVLAELHETRAVDVSHAVDLGRYRLKDIPEPVRLWRLTGDQTPPRAKPARPTNVRQSRTSYVGRDADLSRLAALLDDPGLITVVGPGGVGKTRLVGEFALAHADEVQGGIWMAELASIQAPERLVPALSAALGQMTGDLDELVVQLAGMERCVLLIDNCEHLIDAVVELVEHLVVKCPEATLVCTSREPLRVREERVLVLTPLDPAHGGAELFLERAPEVPGRRLDPELVVELCAALDGLPLAIELAASLAWSTSLEELIEAVSDADPLERRGGESRQRSLSHILDWSLAHLAQGELEAFLVLSVLPGRFSDTMARQILSAAPRTAPEALPRLVDRNLVDLDGDDYRLLSTIRGAARRKLAADPALELQALDAVTRWAYDEGARWSDSPVIHDAMSDDTVLALELAVAHGLDSGARGGGNAWGLLLDIALSRGVSAALLDTASRALTLDVQDPDSARTVRAAGHLHAVRAEGDVRLSVEQADSIIRVAREAADTRLLAQGLSSAAQVVHALGDRRTAIKRYEEILDLLADQPDLGRERPRALNNLANLYMRSDDLGAAAELAASSARETHGVPELWRSHAIARSLLSEIALLQGRPSQSREEALAALAASTPTWRHRGWTLTLLSRAHAALGEREAATAAGRAALPLLVEQAKHDTEARAELEGLLASVPELQPDYQALRSRVDRPRSPTS